MSNQIDKAPVGATHRYFHGPDMDWYCYTDRGLYRWCQGSWCASVHKTIEELANSCPLGRLEAIPSMPAQPVEDDLTWLARNVHEWPAGATHAAKSRLGLVIFGCSVLIGGWFTKSQWLARRAKLQNKPSWKGAPEWATALAQDSAGSSIEGNGGRWWWHESAPASLERTWWSSDRSLPATTGEPLGDWRDTLERRPVDLSSAAVTQRLTEATQNVLAAVPALMGEQFKFEPSGGHKMVIGTTASPSTVDLDKLEESGAITIEEWVNKNADNPRLNALEALRDSIAQMPSEIVADLHQLCDAELTKRDAAVCGGQRYIDAHWFERGELPPAGALCQMKHKKATAEWARPGFDDAFIVAGGDELFISADRKGGKELVGAWNDYEFRPIRTDADRLKDLLTQAGITTCVDEAAEAILSDGFKRGEA